MDRDVMEDVDAHIVDSAVRREHGCATAAVLILDAIAPAIRAAALEEAARVADSGPIFNSCEIGDEIRALITAPPPKP